MKFKVDDKIKMFIHGYKECGQVSDFWFDGKENRYYVLLGKHRVTWSISEKWLKLN